MRVRIGPSRSRSAVSISVFAPIPSGKRARFWLEVVERPQAKRPRLILNPVARVVAYALVLLLSVGVPTRTGSTFFLGNRG